MKKSVYSLLVLSSETIINRELKKSISNISSIMKKVKKIDNFNNGIIVFDDSTIKSISCIDLELSGRDLSKYILFNLSNPYDEESLNLLGNMIKDLKGNHIIYDIRTTNVESIIFTDGQSIEIMRLPKCYRDSLRESLCKYNSIYSVHKLNNKYEIEYNRGYGVEFDTLDQESMFEIISNQDLLFELLKINRGKLL